MLTGKSLFDVHHLPSTRLHEPAAVLTCIFQPILGPDDPGFLQIALVARQHDNRRRHADIQSLGTSPQFLAQTEVILYPLFGFHVYHFHKVVEGAESGCVGDVVDQQERVRSEVGGRP